MNRRGYWVMGAVTGICLSGFLYAVEPTEPAPANFFDMSLEQLMEVQIDSVASLTKSAPRLVPAAVTTITEEQIEASGARSLFELLDIYVPNLQWFRNHWEADNMGLRGILTDKDDKYLLLVNGRVMNERTHYGVISERDLVLLKDIHHIDIIRGSGSALYGPGAVSMVINIVTHTAQTFEGTDVTFRSGAVEEFYSTEIRHGRRFADGDGGLFTYVGIGKYNGADKYDAPQIFGFDFPDAGVLGWDWYDTPSDRTEAGEPFTRPSPNNDGESHRNLPPLKFHLNLSRDGWDVWVRYTRGGKQMVWAPGTIARSPVGWYNWLFLDWTAGSPAYIPLMPNSYGYQQATLYVGRQVELGAATTLDFSFSYDLFDFERVIQNTIAEAYREDEYYGRVLLRHDFTKNHRAAFGAEISHGEFGLKSPGWPEQEAVCADFPGGDMPRWSTNLYSLFGEYQWTLNERWTLFAGARVDDHSYTERLFSPRAALVFTPTAQDAYKLIWSRSVRANFESKMRLDSMEHLGSSDPEKLDSVEFRYERKHSENLDLAASVFLHYNLELISYSSGSSVPIGTQKNWGVELEAFYHTSRARLGVSHGFVQLMDFELDNPTMQHNNITAYPYGYDKDLARWSNHITKLQGRYKLDDQWTLDGSARIYWGFPGMKDYSRYEEEYTRTTSGHTSYMQDGWERAFRGSYFTNLGIQYQPKKNLTFRLDGYYLLGVFNKDFNKRNYGGADYRSHAAAVALSMTYRF